MGGEYVSHESVGLKTGMHGMKLRSERFSRMLGRAFHSAVRTNDPPAFLKWKNTSGYEGEGLASFRSRAASDGARAAH